MSLREAAGVFVAFLLSVSVAEDASGWDVEYLLPTQICAVKGSALRITCKYKHPAQINGRNITVAERFWFKQRADNKPVDLKKDSKYTDRVQYDCDTKECSLTISNLREIDSAEYRFRFITDPVRQVGFTGNPGVTLTVTDHPDLQVRVHHEGNDLTLTCDSRCLLAGGSSFSWYQNQNEHPFYGQTAPTLRAFQRGYSYSCGYDDFRSDPVYSPKVPEVSMSSFGDIRKGESLTLTCRSEANPLPSYTWYKDKEIVGTQSQLKLPSIQSRDSGKYYCSAENELGKASSERLSVNVIYGPEYTYLSAQPSADVERGSAVNLSCKSDANPPASYTWYKDTKILLQGSRSNIFTLPSVSPGDSGVYACLSKNQHDWKESSGLRLNVKYPPQVTMVSRSSLGDIMKGNSLTLTCNSEANPPPRYHWYRYNQSIVTYQQLKFLSIRSLDSGDYYCLAENYLGKASSQIFSVDVIYGPVSSDLSARPSAKVVKGIPVYLTCTSDANPPASYTWYKDNHTLLPRSKTNKYNFDSVRSGDSGVYTCMSENQHGRKMSKSLHLDVQYAPEPPSVSASPSADIVEGSSVNLTCSTDANPLATYTWHKDNERSVKTSGQNLTITDVRVEHGGNYRCEVYNTRGQERAILTLRVASGAWKQAVTVICLLSFILLLLGAFLWIRRNKSRSRVPKRDKTLDVGAQPNAGFDQRPAAPQISLAVREDDLHYAIINFSQQRANDVYSNIGPQRDKEDEEEDVEYSDVRFNSEARPRSQLDKEDLSTVYSTVNKNRT